MRICPECKKEIIGRLDKKFCSPYCKSAYHYDKNKENASTLFKKIDNQLKLNRRILKEFNKGGKAIIRKEVLLKEGFNPKYFTHYWKNSSGDVYLFCYEFGFKSTKESNKVKYILIQWQDYMT